MGDGEARGLVAVRRRIAAIPGAMWRRARECVVALLLVVLPFQSLAAVLLDLQGPAHVHVHASADRDDGGLDHDHHDDGHDHAQVRHRHDEPAAHDHHHGPLDRHHHDAGDATVVMVDEGGEEYASGWSATLLAALPSAISPESGVRRTDVFPAGADARFLTRVPGLPDRPPRGVSL